MTLGRQNALWFLAAALTHLLVFSLTQHQMWPELANASGFVVAFFVSFFGHRLLSFRDASTSVAQSFQRFAVTALAGFFTNEVMFVLLLRGAGWPALLALLGAVAQTYFLSRFCALRR